MVGQSYRLLVSEWPSWEASKGPRKGTGCECVCESLHYNNCILQPILLNVILAKIKQLQYVHTKTGHG